MTLNGRYISAEELNALKKRFPSGSRVMLTRMDDKQAPPPGTKGTVDYIDSIGTIFVSWDNGSQLGVVYKVDKCIRID